MLGYVWGDIWDCEMWGAIWSDGRLLIEPGLEYSEPLPPLDYSLPFLAFGYTVPFAALHFTL